MKWSIDKQSSIYLPTLSCFSFDFSVNHSLYTCFIRCGYDLSWFEFGLMFNLNGSNSRTRFNSSSLVEDWCLIDISFSSSSLMIIFLNNFSSNDYFSSLMMLNSHFKQVKLNFELIVLNSIKFELSFVWGWFNLNPSHA